MSTNIDISKFVARTEDDCSPKNDSSNLVSRLFRTPSASLHLNPGLANKAQPGFFYARLETAYEMRRSIPFLGNGLRGRVSQTLLSLSYRDITQTFVGRASKFSFGRLSHHFGRDIGPGLMPRWARSSGAYANWALTVIAKGFQRIRNRFTTCV